MEGVFRNALVNEIDRQNARGKILVVDALPADEVVLVPPQHLITDKAARYVKGWLARAKNDEAPKSTRHANDDPRRKSALRL